MELGLGFVVAFLVPYSLQISLAVGCSYFVSLRGLPRGQSITLL